MWELGLQRLERGAAFRTSLDEHVLVEPGLGLQRESR
jgi:hypothetical protein